MSQNEKMMKLPLIIFQNLTLMNESSSTVRTCCRKATTRPRNRGPRRKIGYCCVFAETSKPVLRKSLRKYKAEMLRCATAASGDSPTRPKLPGHRKRMNGYWHWWKNMESSSGKTSSLCSRVRLSLFRSYSQANPRPLREPSEAGCKP